LPLPRIWYNFSLFFKKFNNQLCLAQPIEVIGLLPLYMPHWQCKTKDSAISEQISLFFANQQIINNVCILKQQYVQFLQQLQKKLFLENCN